MATGKTDDAIRPSKAARSLRRILEPKPPMTQSGLARELGVTQQAVSVWLKGISRPSPERIARIEELLGVPVADWASFERESDTDASAEDSGEHAAIDAPKTGT